MSASPENESADSGRIGFSRDLAVTEVTLTVPFPTAILLEVSSKPDKSRKKSRAPRIRVPNNERAIFIVEESKFLGVIQRLSVTGGSAVLAKGPIARGAMGKMILVREGHRPNRIPANWRRRRPACAGISLPRHGR